MAFNTAISGLAAAYQDLNVIGNNIANANTSGFKSSRVDFSDVYQSAGGPNSSISSSGSGASAARMNQLFSQGGLSLTGNNLDLTVEGSGFFVINNAGKQEYTRAGLFNLDDSGKIINSQGYSVQGYQADNADEISTTLGDLKIKGYDLSPRQTSKITAQINLDSRQAATIIENASIPVKANDPTNTQNLTQLAPENPGVIPAKLAPDPGVAQIAPSGLAVVKNVAFNAEDPTSYNYSTAVPVLDSLGNSHTLNLFFAKKDTVNQWNVFAKIDGNNVGDPNPGSSTATVAKYNIEFNKDGTLNSSASDPIRISYWNPTGALKGSPVASGGTFSESGPFTSSNLVINLDKMTQLNSDFSIKEVNQNGFPVGALQTLNVAEDGKISAQYSNGQSDLLGQLSLATFKNIQGLKQSGNTNWVAGQSAGEPILNAPTQAGLGSIKSGALENSNVELSSQLVSLIIAQRNFQANSKTIQTEDAIAQAIINLY